MSNAREGNAVVAFSRAMDEFMARYQPMPSDAAATRIGGALFVQMDANEDGMVSEAEFIAHEEMMFSRMDRNRDGMIGENERGMMMEDGASMEEHLRDLLAGPLARQIATADHCYGCTAGQGSSCGGAFQEAGT